MDLGVYENTVGRDGIIDTSTGWAHNEDDELFGWIEYNIAETHREDMYGEKGGQEVYVPGVVRSEKPGANYFMPVIWSDEREDIKEIIGEETGIETVRWRPKHVHYAGDKKSGLSDPENEVFDIALAENEIELETGLDRETGTEKWAETGAVTLGKRHHGDEEIYGYVKEFTRRTDMDLEDPIEIEAEIAGRLEPYGELEMPDEDDWHDIASRIVKKDEDIESIHQVKFDENYLQNDN